MLIGPLPIPLLVGLQALFLLFEVAAKRLEIYDYVSRGVLLIIGLVILAWGMTKRNPTEMA